MLPRSQPLGSCPNNLQRGGKCLGLQTDAPMERIRLTRLGPQRYSRRLCLRPEVTSKQSASVPASLQPGHERRRSRRDLRPSGKTAPALVLEQVAAVGLPIMGKAASRAVAAGQSAAAAAVAAGQTAAATTYAAGQYCGERAALVAQVARARILSGRPAGDSALVLEAADAPSQDLPVADGVAQVEAATAGREKGLLSRVVSTTSGVLAFTGDYCSPLIQQLPFRSSSPAISRLQEEVDAAVADLTEQFKHPVLELIRERLRDGSKPLMRRDTALLALVVEGGGMRGAVSAGGLQALHDLNMRDVFDVVYGSSAGAINLTYFLSGQRQGVDIYHEDIANTRFVNLLRLFRRADEPPALDLSFLLDHVMEKVKPLDWDAVLKSPIPLRVVASCLDEKAPVVLDGFSDAQDLKLALMASANVPEVAGTYVEHRGRRLVDAAVFEPIPFRCAIGNGCTHVLTLCSRTVSTDPVARVLDGLVSGVVKRTVMYSKHMRPMWDKEEEWARAFGISIDDMVLLGREEGHHRHPVFDGSHMYPCHPRPPVLICSDLHRCADHPQRHRSGAQSRDATV
eukprot:jgi/Botrbrau1/14437/Bobra.0014s0083.1